jgi:hypothetical protein
LHFFLPFSNTTLHLIETENSALPNVLYIYRAKRNSP